MISAAVSRAAFPDLERGAREAAMGGASAAAAEDPGAIFRNSALTAELSFPAFSSSWSRPFGLSDLDNGSVAAAYPLSFGVMSAGVTFMGREGYYTETEVLLSFARKFDIGIHGNISPGAACRCSQLNISPVYGSDRTFSIDAGLLWKKSRRFSAGFAARNLTNSRLGLEEEALPRIYTFGVAARPFENVLLATDTAWENTAGFTRLIYRFGQEVLLFRPLILRAGFRTDPAAYSVGAGFLFFSFRVDYAYQFHPVLPGTHMITIHYRPSGFSDTAG